jgi:hypothetical protein
MRFISTEFQLIPFDISSIKFQIPFFPLLVYNQKFNSILRQGSRSGQMKIIEEAKGVDEWKSFKAFFFKKMSNGLC